VPVRILFQDPAVVAIDKPSGTIVHRGPRTRDEERPLLSEVRDAIGQRVHPVHRLDRGTSGVLLLALDVEAARRLGEAFAGGGIGKRYLALVRGVPPEGGIIDHAIPRREDGPRVPAVTEYRRLDTVGRYSWVEARPRTGRLHQVRRHLKHISCPIIGDVNYGKGEHNRLFRERYDLHRLALHAAALTFPHPTTGEPVTVEAPLPDDLAAPLRALGIAEAHLA
jgi:tRNA pseudouridine65 synthase